HDVLLERLRRVEAVLQGHFGQQGAEPIQTRAYVDTGPVVERWFAQLSGIGWIGKNTCVLNQQQGSYLLLAVILVSAPLVEEAILLPAADRCGSCTRCIDACPTDALIAPRRMDATRCIAYLTIEKKGSLDSELMPQMGRQVFGCDICQDVCPWNRRAPIGKAQDMAARPELVNPSLEALAAMDAPAFKRAFKGSPLERTGRRRLQRNVAIAMGNSGNRTHCATLEAWAKGEDPMLAEAAEWALTRLNRLELPSTS
ncbi:MAG: tRNA epoxyqueuosine(34) reductase QueG, partial [Terriglobus sp.]